MKTLKKFQPIAPLYTPFDSLSTKLKNLIVSFIIVFILSITPSKAYSLDEISFEHQSDNAIVVSNKIDLTKLPRGEIFKVVHEDFVLQFFFNNRDIFGGIFKRKSNIGIIARLCLYRSCEASSYDFRKVIAKAFEPPYDKTFFSIKFPQTLQYEFQGIEFNPHK